MLALLSLLFLVCTQAALTVPSEDSPQGLGELSDLLTADVPKPITTPPPTTTTTTPPPTTTTTPQAEEPCGKKHPTDINFIFSPAALGLDESSTVTSFISEVTLAERVEEGFRYGIMSAYCPHDAGFSLDKYDETKKLCERLDSYDHNNLPALVFRAAQERFGPHHGGRANAKKVAVIFLGNVKVSVSDLSSSIQKLQDEGVKVYVSVPKEKMVGDVSGPWPKGVTFLTGETRQQVDRLLGDLCPKSDK